VEIAKEEEFPTSEREDLRAKSIGRRDGQKSSSGLRRPKDELPGNPTAFKKNRTEDLPEEVLWVEDTF